MGYEKLRKQIKKLTRKSKRGWIENKIKIIEEGREIQKNFTRKLNIIKCTKREVILKDEDKVYKSGVDRLGNRREKCKLKVNQEKMELTSNSLNLETKDYYH